MIAAPPGSTSSVCASYHCGFYSLCAIRAQWGTLSLAAAALPL
jgi:hypothetical protein